MGVLVPDDGLIDIDGGTPRMSDELDPACKAGGGAGGIRLRGKEDKEGEQRGVAWTAAVAAMQRGACPGRGVLVPGPPQESSAASGPMKAKLARRPYRLTGVRRAP